MDAHSATHVLVVDDDEYLRALLRDLFEDEGFVVFEAANGRDALDVLAGQTAPVVVLVDDHMPLMSGLQLLQAIKAPYCDQRRCACMLVTGSSDQTLPELSVPIVYKPFDLDDLVELVTTSAHELQRQTCTRK